MKKMNKKGFTIVELVIVIAVIAILAAVLIPTFSGVVEKANASSALQSARSTLTKALNMSSTASLAGNLKTGEPQTVIVTDGYAFGYSGNQIESINYPGYKDAPALKNGAIAGVSGNFNAIIIAAENLVPVENDAKNYTLCSTAPADWATTYTTYYKLENNKFTAVAEATDAPAFENNKYYTKNEIATVYEIKNVDSIITKLSDENQLGCTSIKEIINVTLIDGVYYLNYGAVDYKVGDVVYLKDDDATTVSFATAASVEKFDATTGANVWSEAGEGHTKAYTIKATDYGFIGKAAIGEEAAITAKYNPGSYDATIYINSDFAKNVVVFTTFG